MAKEPQPSEGHLSQADVLNLPGQMTAMTPQSAERHALLLYLECITPLLSIQELENQLWAIVLEAEGKREKAEDSIPLPVLCLLLSAEEAWVENEMQMGGIFWMEEKEEIYAARMLGKKSVFSVCSHIETH